MFRRQTLMCSSAMVWLLGGCLTIPTGQTEKTANGIESRPAFVHEKNGDQQHRSVAYAKMEQLRNGMSSAEVCAALGREPDGVLRLGGSLGDRECWWNEDRARIVVHFDVAGQLVDRWILPSKY